MSKYQRVRHILSCFTVAVVLFVISISAISNTLSNTRNATSSVTCCRTERCILSYGFSPIYSHYDNSGKYIVGYRNLKMHSGAGYTARQVGHGIMCMATLGLWEIAAGPIEESVGNIILEATYLNKRNHFVEKIKINADI
jgi:hypothetical protein